MDILLSDAALNLYVFLIITLIGFLVKKGYVKKQYSDIAVDLFEHIEDNYKDWGMHGNAKMDFFMSQFKDTYQNKFDKVPTDEIVTEVVNLVELLVERQKIK